MMVKIQSRGSGAHTREHHLKNQRGIIIPTVIFVILLSLAAGGILMLTLNSYKLSKRNEMRARARSLAESEMEIFFYKYKDFLMTGRAVYANDIPNLFHSLGNSYICDTTTPQTPGSPYVKIYSDAEALDPNNLEKDDWIVRRSITASLINPSGVGNDQYVIQGTIPGTTKTGKFSYLIARIIVEPGPTNPLYGSVAVRIGRRLNYATASVFQYNVFAQGDLEFAPGGNTVIEGDIAANGSVYMGASSGGTLTVNGTIRYLLGNYVNQTKDANGNLVATFRKPGTLSPTGGAVVADTTTLAAPILNGQISVMSASENLLGGLDAKSIAASNPDLFGALVFNSTTNAYEPTNADINNVYRSIIAPPPDAVARALNATSDSLSAEYPSSTTLSNSYADNPSIAALRAYNRAGIIVTVGPDGTISSITGKTTSASGVTTTTDLTSTLKDSVVTTTKTVTAPDGTVSTAPLSLYDQREGKSVALAEVNVQALNTALATGGAIPHQNPNYTFNGLIYVYLANSSSTAPAAVRLINGANTPGSATAKGFSVATNGGLYVQGDYNTNTSTNDSATSNTYTGKINPTMLMADSVTILSSAWNDANSTGNGATVSSSDITHRVAATGTTTINSGILTGNVSATVSTTAPTASGGGQNLVRFLEDWTGRSVTMRGSLGRLFDSKHFIATYQQPGNVYRVPGLRTFSFNAGLTTETVPGQPLITYFSRGDFFNW